MGYLVLARKYRPTTFDEVVGQESTAATLKNAVASGRVAHAYLFTGPRGVGKTTMARILAKALNCKQGPTPDPCNECALCKSIDTGDDVDVVEIDGASNNSVDQVRSLRENARYAPARARHKIYIIDEVHMLSTAAFNALLKTLEEPPPHVKFIFATTEPHKLLDTIRSRCQRFDFRRIPSSLIAEHLASLCKKENIQAADGVLEAVARSAHGGMRDAESLLDQLAALTDDQITLADLEQLVGATAQQTLFGILEALGQHDARKAVELVDDALAKGAAYDELIQQLTEGCRELLLTRVAGRDTALIDRNDADRARIAELADLFTTEGLTYLVQMFAEIKRKARDSSQSRVVLELALIQAADVHDLRPLGEILSRLRALEAGRGVRQSARPAPPARSQSAPAAHAPGPPARTGDLWADALALVEQQKAPLAHFIAGATCRPAPESVGTGPAKYILDLGPIAINQARANKNLIENALTTVNGGPCVIELRPASNAKAAPPEPSEHAAEPKGEHIQKAMDLLGARVVATSDHSNPPRSNHEGQ
jgi:DNA polymerase-3 subunit gamma/tau